MNQSVLYLQADSARTLREALKTAADQTDTRISRVEITLKGTILLDKALELTNNRVPILLRGEEAVLDGGYRVQGFQPVTVNGVSTLCAPIDPTYAETLLFDQLFVNGKRRYRPVFPEHKSGFCGVVKEKNGFREMIPDDWITANSIFRYRGQIPQLSRPEDVEFHVCHCWLHERMQVSRIDYENNRVYTKTATRFCVLDREFCALVNVFEMFKQPGQYYFDRAASVLYYIPMEGESADSIEVVIPCADRLLQLTHTSNVSIQDLTFRYVSGRSDYRTTVKRDKKPRFVTLTHRQSECEMGGVVSFTDASDCRITGCTFEHVGVYGVDINDTADNISVSGCTFRDLGSGALKTQYDEKRGIRVRGVRFTDNRVDGYGKAYLAACAVLLTHVSESAVDNNDICDGEYTAISLGWTWGYGNTGYHSNSVCGNHLHHIGKKRVDDMGAIYTLGVQPFTRIAGNHIHDITSWSGVCFGIYLDEGSSCMTVENNLVYRINGDAMHLHYGRDNIIRRNIFADCTKSLLSCTREEAHVQLYVEHNVFFQPDGHMLRTKNQPGSENNVCSERNLYYANGGVPGFSCTSFTPDEAYLPLEQWQTDMKNDTASIVTDPLFVDAASGDYRLSPSSPAMKELGYSFEKWAAADQT